MGRKIRGRAAKPIGENSRILDQWAIFSDMGVSTPTAIQMTADAAGVSYGDVVEVLQRQKREERKPCQVNLPLPKTI